jgi:hypothetical protein
MARAKRPALPDLPSSGVLDWSDAKRHWHFRLRPCRYCKGPTSLRDEEGRPSHKTCAETHRARQQAHAAQVYAAQAQLDD